jgi:hypothetical protein
LGAKLTLRGFQAVHGSDVFRADLTDDSGSYSSGYRTRNVLFVSGDGEAHWLLPDDDHVVEEHPIASPPPRQYGEQPPPVAMLALATLAAGDPQLGDLYLYDPSGRNIKQVDHQVREVHGASLTAAGATVLYERSNGYVLARYDPDTLTKVGESAVAVPALE